MKLKLSALLAFAILLMVACTSKEKTTIPASTDKVLIVQHPVADYDLWRPYFDNDDAARKGYGITTIGVGRAIDNPNDLILYFKIEDTAKVNTFMSQPELKAIMDSAGVTGAPTSEYLNSLRNDTLKTDITDRILVKHKVKDFDAWLKVYDDEGMDKRKSFGLVDRALGRGMDDPNMVYIVFAVSDWDKANARMQSEELKKIMTDAGVEGPPTFTKYKIKLMQ